MVFDPNGQVYDIEEIVDHKKGKNGKTFYYVKWKGYDSDENTWEPEENFASLKVVMEYHKKRNEESKKKRHTMDKQLPRKQTMTPNDEKLIDESIVHGEFLSDEYIRENNLVPRKVLNISHIKNEEKNLVALIRFDGEDDPAFVFTEWANEHCPQLVITYYESRIRWEKKPDDELIKAEAEAARA